MFVGDGAMHPGINLWMPASDDVMWIWVPSMRFIEFLMSMNYFRVPYSEPIDRFSQRLDLSFKSFTRGNMPDLAIAKYWRNANLRYNENDDIDTGEYHLFVPDPSNSDSCYGMIIRHLAHGDFEFTVEEYQTRVNAVTDVRVMPFTDISPDKKQRIIALSQEFVRVCYNSAMKIDECPLLYDMWASLLRLCLAGRLYGSPTLIRPPDYKPESELIPLTLDLYIRYFEDLIRTIGMRSGAGHSVTLRSLRAILLTAFTAEDRVDFRTVLAEYGQFDFNFIDVTLYATYRGTFWTILMRTTEGIRSKYNEAAQFVEPTALHRRVFSIVYAMYLMNKTYDQITTFLNRWLSLFTLVHRDRLFVSVVNPIREPSGDHIITGFRGREWVPVRFGDPYAKSDDSFSHELLWLWLPMMRYMERGVYTHMPFDPDILFSEHRFGDVPEWFVRRNVHLPIQYPVSPHPSNFDNMYMVSISEVNGFEYYFAMMGVI
jgi:hypothetical protein